MVCVLLTILAGVAMPVTKFTYTRTKEMQLRSHLRAMRNAIDEYKRYSDAGLIEVDIGSDGYPESLETLVEGADVVGLIDRRVRFLRRVPVDPFTNEAEWGVRSFQDEPDSQSSSGQNVYDVYSESGKRGLNGIAYSKW